MLNESVKALLKSHLWDLATCGRDGEPNVVPVTFKEVTEEGKLTVGDVFLETTLEICAPAGKSPCPSMTEKSWRAVRSRALRNT